MMHCPLFLLPLLLLVCVHSAPTPQEKQLLDHVRENGSLADFTIGKACSTCLRGSTATRDIKAGELLMAIDLEKEGIQLASFEYDVFAAEYAYHLAIQLYGDDEFRTKHKLFLDTLPKEGDLFSGELFEDHHLDMLGSENLKELIVRQRSITEEVYFGNLSFRAYEPLSQKLGAKTPSLSAFKHLAALVGSRDFAVQVRPGEERSRYFLVPVADLINHDDNPNAERSDNGTHLLEKAMRNIPKGTEITNAYQTNVIHRNDLSLLIYGFIQNKPLMCATDLPKYTSADPYSATAVDDSLFYGRDGRFNTKAEYQRLAALLYEIPSSDDIDRALLWSRSFWGWPIYKLRCSSRVEGWLGVDCPAPLPKFTWKEEMLLKFRIHRRKMIKTAMKKIKRQLDMGMESPEYVDDLPPATTVTPGAPPPEAKPIVAEDDPYGDPDEL